MTGAERRVFDRLPLTNFTRELGDTGTPVSKNGYKSLACQVYMPIMQDDQRKIPLLQTPFHKRHIDQGAKMVEFAGWEMPIMYTSIIDEHKQVRESGGVFDVSHMGRVKIGGKDARKFLEHILSRRISTMKTGQCRYSLICNEEGGVRDDVIVYRYDEHWLLVVNASNREKILDHMKANTGDYKVKIDDLTKKTSMLAIQGPNVIEQFKKFSSEVPALKRYSFCEKSVLILKMTISRTGYTGEDGVEVILPAKMPAMAMDMLLKSGGEEAQEILKPAGLGARDSLRLEAGMPLYGHELDEDTDPLTVGLDFAISLDKGETDADKEKDVPGFIGQEALKKNVTEGSARKLVGLKLKGRRTPRQGMAVRQNGSQVGTVTSGCLSPTLGYPIAMAMVDRANAVEGATVNVQLGSKAADAEIVPMPFYKRD